MEKRFEGEIHHTEATIKRLYKTEALTYEKIRMLTRVVMGALLVILALAGELPLAAQAALLLVGCWLLVSGDFPSDNKADRAVQARHGILPKLSYTFYEENVVLDGEGRMELSYQQFQRLVEDDSYLYLFLKKGSACMIDRSRVQGGSDEELKRFVAQKTGVEWTRNKSLLAMNARDLWRAIRDHRQR